MTTKGTNEVPRGEIARPPHRRRIMKNLPKVTRDLILDQGVITKLSDCGTLGVMVMG